MMSKNDTTVRVSKDTAIRLRRLKKRMKKRSKKIKTMNDVIRRML